MMWGGVSDEVSSLTERDTREFSLPSSFTHEKGGCLQAERVASPGARSWTSWLPDTEKYISVVQPPRV